MQAYWGNPENKNYIMTLMVEEHEAFPPVKTPESRRGALDYEDQLGIPVPLALLAERMWCGMSARDARTWPARFFGTIEPGHDLSAVVWKAVALFLQAMPVTQQDWRQAGDQLLAVLASAPLSGTVQ